MKLVCPICNGLYKVNYDCPKCNSAMEDKGPQVNYMDDYSPYLLDEVTHLIDGVKREQCLHIYQCTECNTKETYSVERKEF